MTRNSSALRLAASSAVALALFAASPAAAQESSGGHIVTVGLGAQALPQYPGADSYSIHPLVLFGFRREGAPMPFSSLDDGPSFGLLGQDRRFNFGPSFWLRAKRQQADVGAPVGDVAFTVEAGGFVELYPTRYLRLRGDLRQGINGHKGLVGDLGADLIVRDDNDYIFSIGPRARWGDADFSRAYFGVSPSAAAASHLPVFQPRSGFYALGAIANLTYRLGHNWGMRGYAGYDRLINDAGRSPIVRNFGSRDQFSGGAGLFVEFNVGGHRR